MASRPPSKGRRRIEIKRIVRDHARQVCFSKRRRGLFKKAYELSILCGVEVGVLVFSPGGKPFFFGHPTSFDQLVDRFLTNSTAAANIEQEPVLPIWCNADVEKLGLEELQAYEKALVELRSALQVPAAEAADRVSAREADLAIVPYGMPALASSSSVPSSSSLPHCFGYQMA